LARLPNEDLTNISPKQILNIEGKSLASFDAFSKQTVHLRRKMTR
jgi:hypothetical protein